MRRHGWQLPYHPLQVVAIAVFLALGFAFYVFFVPFVGKKLFQYVVMGLYTPLVLSVCCIYIWCAAADPGDPGVFKSKKCLNFVDARNSVHGKESKQSRSAENISQIGDKPLENVMGLDSAQVKSSKEQEKNNTACCIVNVFFLLFSWCPCSLIWTSPCSREQTSEEQSTEDGMFYCNLCEVEVYKYSKHCRVCDKCVDGFDHHCRWLNNCIGRKNYRRFFVLMVSALLLLILQWSAGILVLVRCFVERRHFNVDIATKLGSSFSLVPFIVVVVSCTLLAMVATLPLAQLFFFHVLLIQKGISTYDYIMALREQEQQGVGGLQSPQMSTLSSFTGLSSTSSFNTFHRAGWCTPPRLFVEDQCFVVPPETSSGKRMVIEEHNRKKPAGAVKISPWTLARLDAEEVSKAAAQARKKSKILQRVVRRESLAEQETDNSFGSRSGRIASRIDHRRQGVNKRGGGSSRLPPGLSLERLAKISASATDSNESDIDPETCTNLAPLQHEARSAFHTSRALSCTEILASSSPESSLESLDRFDMASGTTEAILASSVDASSQNGIRLSRSTSDGYEASGGEDSDRVPSRIVHRSSNWSNLAFNSARSTTIDNILRASTSTGMNASNLGRPF